VSCELLEKSMGSDSLSAFAGVDVAFAKGKRLPIVICTWRGNRLVPEALRRLPFEPPVGLGNAQSCVSGVVEDFARAAVEYLVRVQAVLHVRIVRIGIDAPSAARVHAKPRRLAEAALDAAGISCFTTPSDADFSSIRLEVERHLASGGHESNLPHANQLWMQVGFALFRQLRVISDCLEVYPQATVRELGVGSLHKFKAGGVDAPVVAVSAYTGWPDSLPREAKLDEIAWGSRHDQLDAYLAAWVAALDETERVPFGVPPDDVIWVPRVKRINAPKTSVPVARQSNLKPIQSKLPRPTGPRQCRACPTLFKDFPLGWDAHAVYRCSGLGAGDAESKKREYKERFGHLFKFKFN
jgi:hypothetical protein